MMGAFKSWKTSASGAFSLPVLFKQIEHLVSGNLELVQWEVIALGVGLLLNGIFARDSDKSSQDHQVRK